MAWGYYLRSHSPGFHPAFRAFDQDEPNGRRPCHEHDPPSDQEFRPELVEGLRRGDHQCLPLPIRSLTANVSSSNLESRLLKAAFRHNTRSNARRHLLDERMLDELRNRDRLHVVHVRLAMQS